jgi:hypothetical protein
VIWNQPSSIISPRGKGSQICFQGQVTKVEDLIPTNQKWIWMNEHTKFYLHNISMKHMNLMVGYWNLLVVNWNQNVFDEIQRAIIMVLMGLFVLSHRPSFRLVVCW